MRRPIPWRVLASESRADYSVFTVTELACVRAEGEAPHAFFRIDSVDWANVIPVTREGEIVMIRQYRHGAAATTLEIPGGMVDAGESPADAAARELLEETGYRAGRIVPLGSVNPNPALFANRLHSFLAEDCEKVAEVANDHAEETVVELVPAREVRRLLAAGAIDHALVMAAFHFWSLRDG
jgi:8-oxo-dGTP pyrophosphatase MutT (NUDIX family)